MPQKSLSRVCTEFGVQVRPRLQSKIRKVCLAIVAALIAAGVLLPFIGFAAAGFNPTVFTAEADERTSELTLGLARQI